MGSDLEADCWSLQVTNCDELRAVRPDCLNVQLTMRLLLVLSNLVYIAPVAFVCFLYIKKGRLMLTEMFYGFSFFSVAVFSSLYHACDDASKNLPCYKYCLNGVEFDQTRVADLAASLVALHATSLFQWDPKTDLERAFILLSSLSIVLGVMYVFKDDEPTYAYLSSFVLLMTVFFMRTYKTVFSKFSVLYFLLYLSFSAASILFMFILKQDDLEYGRRHTIWHATSMLSSFTFAVFLHSLKDPEIPKLVDLEKVLSSKHLSKRVN